MEAEVRDPDPGEGDTAMMRTVRTYLALLCAWGAAISQAPAQSVSYLLPDRYEMVAESEVALHVAREKLGASQRAPWPGHSLEWLFVRSAGTQRNFSEWIPERAGDDFVRLTLSEPDVAMIGMDLRPWVEQVPGAQMREFLELQVGSDTLPADWPADWRARTSSETVRVRHVESTKLLLRVVRGVPEGKGARQGSATALSKSGQRAELRPLADPTAIAVGSDLPLRVYWADSTSPLARIVARHVVTGKTQVSLAPGGAGFFTVSAPGTWQVEAHRAKLLRDDPAASWELETATLSFVVPSPNQTERDGK